MKLSKLSRKEFLKLSGFAATASVLAGSGHGNSVLASNSPFTRLEYAREVPTICPYCSLGCGIICSVKDGVVINTEGDPEHPINEGTLCSKGSSIYNLSYVYDSKGRPRLHPNRLTKVLYRRPKSSEWESISWEEAFEKIAKRIKETRDKTFEKTDSQGVTVSRTPSIAHLGSAVCNNEENYLYHKLIRSLGLINIDHCARL